MSSRNSTYLSCRYACGQDKYLTGGLFGCSEQWMCFMEFSCLCSYRLTYEQTESLLSVFPAEVSVSLYPDRFSAKV